MTLFESLVALIILGLTAVGFLQAFQTSTRSTQSAAEWTRAASYGESVMELTKLGPEGPVPSARDSLPGGFARTVDVQPWPGGPGGPGVQEITVTISLPGRGTFVLHRLVRSP